MNMLESAMVWAVVAGCALGWIARSAVQRRIDRDNGKANQIGEDCLSSIAKIIEQRKFTGPDVQITRWLDYSAGPFGDFRINIVEKKADEESDKKTVGTGP